MQLLTPQPDGSYGSQVFGRRDGMLHEECNTNAQLLDRHGRFWTGTLAGLTVFDPARRLVDHQAKPLSFDQVLVDDRPVDWPSGRLQLQPGERELQIGFALRSWHREGESRYRVHLAGYDVQPAQWSEQSRVNYNGLPPGHYGLEVEARDYAGNVSGPLKLSIEVIPAWWQRPLTQWLLAALVPLLAFAVGAWRARQLRAQRRHLETVVAHRTEELHAANTRLRELSYTDALTGLPNRRCLLDALAAAQPAPVALLFLDVDHFKDFNDEFGHPAGDEALRQVALAMRTVAPPDALLSRYGGEEFACLLRSAEDPAEVEMLAERLRIAVAGRPVALPGTTQVEALTISLGVAIGPLAGEADAHRLLKDADLALYAAKRAGRDCWRTPPLAEITQRPAER